MTSIPRFSSSLDPDGVASHVPHVDHFYDNSLQTGLMCDLTIDLELLGEHLVLLGNQVFRFLFVSFYWADINIIVREWARTK
jgi:hypothetical protein